MASLTEYKCPACGGAMEFDTDTQNMKCPYCDTVIPIAEFRKMQEEAEKKEKEQAEAAAGDAGETAAGETATEAASELSGKPNAEGTSTAAASKAADAGATASEASGEWSAVGDGKWQEGETDGLNIYMCRSCGGEIVAEEQTGALSCPYCGNRIVLKEQFSGDLKPDFVIPFQLDKKAAKNAYYRHLEGKPFLPRIFKDENHINEIKGVYVPFWIFDASAEAEISYSAKNLRIWRVGDIEYTEHKSFSLEREGRIDFESIPADASKNMDDALMESIEPFDFSKAVPFTPEYLAGFVADRYDVEKDDRIERIKERVSRSIEDSFEKTLPNYDSINKNKCNIRFKQGKYAYALYPVWLLSTTWNNHNYLFAMNGQTGKMVGDLPADDVAFWKYVGIRTVIAAVVIHLISMLIMRF